MADILGGLPKTVSTITDNSAIVNNGEKGIVDVLGITQRGKPNDPVLCRSWDEYRRFFGELVSYSLFPLFCKRAFDRGALLRVSRVAHYTTITDLGTATGVKATGTATLSGSSAVFTAKSHGTWGNGVTIGIVAGAAGIANTVDITVVVASNTSQNQTIYNVPIAPTSGEKATFNAASRHVDLGTVTVAIPVVASTALTAGTDDYSALTDTDYLGDSGTLTGIHAFDNFNDADKICIPENTSAAVDAGLLAYVVMRGDMLAYFRAPSNISGYEAVDWRNKAGAFSGTKLDSWQGRAFFGDLTVTDPLTNTSRDISAIGDILGAASYRSAKTDPWVALARKPWGVLTNYIKVVYNIFPAARRAEADKLVQNRLNPVVDTGVEVQIYADESLQVADTLLKNANVAEFMVYLLRTVPPIVQKHLFKPNDIPTWRDIYRDVRDHMENIADRRGVYGKEDTGWKYVGDQDVDVITNVTVNNLDDIASGIYRFRLFVKPTPVLKYIGIDFSISALNVDYSIVEEV